MQFKSEKFCLSVIDALPVKSDVEKPSYDHDYELDPDFQASSSYLLSCEPGSITCLISTAAGATSVCKQSVFIHNSCCYLAIGDRVVSLALPSLTMNWCKKLDEVTCYSLFQLPNKEGIIVHGELAVSRVSLDGICIWKQTGRDIFSGDFTLHEHFVEVFDFQGKQYRFSLTDGSHYP